MKMQTIESHSSVSVDAIWQPAYQRGIRDTLDQLAGLARDPQRARGEASIVEALRRLGRQRRRPQ